MPVITKYRPYFTADELSEIILCLKSNPTPRRLSIIRYLEAFKLKIDHGVINAAHTTSPTFTDSLELEDTLDRTKSIIGESAYQKQLIAPKSCTPHEIALAMQYRYESNLMSKDEEKQYELQIGLAI